MASQKCRERARIQSTREGSFTSCQCVRACGGDYRGESAANPAACKVEGGITDGAAPVSLDDAGGAAGAGEQEGEGVAEVAELVEVIGAVGLAIEEGDGLESDEGDVGCVGRRVRGDDLQGPMRMYSR